MLRDSWNYFVTFEGNDIFKKKKEKKKENWREKNKSKKLWMLKLEKKLSHEKKSSKTKF